LIAFADRQEKKRMDQPPTDLPPASRSVAPPSAQTPPRRARWRGAAVALAALVALGALAWYLTHRAPVTAVAGGGVPGGGPPAGPPGGGPGGRGGRAGASTVGVATAKKLDVPVYLEALGTVTPLATVTVTAQVSGVLTQVLFNEGQMVKKGDVLAVIDPKPFQAVLAQAEGARLRDTSQLDSARVTLLRYQTLLSQDSIARQDADTQAALVKQLEGTVAMDKAAEDTARLNLGWSRVVAPLSGRVGLRTVDAGNYVSAGGSTGVAVITQITPIDAVFAVPQARLPEVQSRIGDGAKLLVVAIDQTRTRQLDTGRFLTLDNQIDLQTGTVKAKARFDNAAGTLFPNQFVNVRVLLRTIEGAVTVPVTAMRHGPNGDFVYVVKDDQTVALRIVTRGEATVSDVIVASGLELGEEVVTEGGDRLKDGARVQLAADRPARGASGPGSGGSGARGRRGGGASDAASGGHRRHAEDASGSRPAAAASSP
jgi:membrane fusion protein, multidrug efflux system